MDTISYAKLIKARKRHICDFCGERISEGEKHMKSIHVDDHIYEWRTHIYCNKLSHTLKMYDECNDGVSANDFQEYVSEKHFDILVNQLPNYPVQKYYDIISQFNKVKFRDKLWFVIRYLNKLEQELKEMI